MNGLWTKGPREPARPPDSPPAQLGSKKARPEKSDQAFIFGSAHYCSTLLASASAAGFCLSFRNTATAKETMKHSEKIASVSL
jgi:hypothetical protein